MLALADFNVHKGYVVRIGPNEVATGDPEMIRRINAVRSTYKRSAWYDATSFDHSRNYVFCERDEVRHVELRNQMIPGVITSNCSPGFWTDV
jgi:hypothetical protein